MFSIAVAQTRNSIDMHENFRAITNALKQITNKNVQLVLFPECALSGFSAKMKNCTEEFLAEYLNEVQAWVNHNQTSVLLPTAFAKENRIYNSIYCFQPGSRKQFFKTGLTPSEKDFFSVPEDASKKIIEVNGLRMAVLICREVQDKPWEHFSEGEADVILWPGYWGWVKEDQWTEVLSTGEENTALKNMKSWRIPLIQSNFAFNDLKDFKGPGPIGKSVVVDSSNQLLFQGAYHEEQVFIVDLQKDNNKVDVLNCYSISQKADNSVESFSLNLLR